MNNQHIQRRNLGDGDAVDGIPAGFIGPSSAAAGAHHGEGGRDNVVSSNQDQNGVVLVPRPTDGLVREVKTNKVVSREQTDELLETEDVRHFGDFSDEVSFFLIGF